MAIVSSTYALEPVQADGRRWVLESHTDGQSHVHQVSYLAAAGSDPVPLLATHAQQVAAQLAIQEFHGILTGARPFLPLQHQTAAEFALRLREAYLTASRETCARLAAWLIDRISAGEVTDAQARAAFGMTALAWTTFKTTKLQPLRDSWVAVQAAQGE